jgi:peroxiredoxin/predicted 2-oxoglutarate/Fe(II)-dependent dioxygenase YbiX
MTDSSPHPRPRYINLQAGDPAPWFFAASTTNPRYAFHTAGGRYVVLCFLGSAADPLSEAALQKVQAQREIFDDTRACFFGVTLDPSDATEKRVQESMPGIRFFLDFDGAISKAYGAIPLENSGTQVSARRFWVILDPTLRVLRVVPLKHDGLETETVLSYVKNLPPPDRFAGVPLQAPILYLPNVFEPEFCQSLIEYYEQQGGTESGFMREENGKTVGAYDAAHKRRRDFTIEDQALIQATQIRIRRRVIPEILKIHQFNATRMERYLVGCYTAEDGGHFRAHRDNTTKGTAHRRFAVSINLNDDFEGGEVSFPEYGARSFKAPPGGCVVFSCSLLHAVSKVTHGQRYAFLPFLYDDAAAKIRQENISFLEGAERTE